MFSIFWLWSYKTDQTHQKLEQEKDEKYKAELLIAAKRQKQLMRQKPSFFRG